MKLNKIKGKNSIYDYESVTPKKQTDTYNTTNLTNSKLGSGSKEIDIDEKFNELLNCQKEISNNNSVIENDNIKLDEEESKLIPEQIKNENKDKDNVLINNRMRSKKRSEQMRKRLDKVSGEKFYFKYECGIDNGHDKEKETRKLFNHYNYYFAFNII